VQGGALVSGAPLFLGIFSYFRIVKIVVMNDRTAYTPPARSPAFNEELLLLEQGDAVVDFSGHGILRLEGKDSLDFLHRISTNDLKDLRPGQSVQTVLTTEKGRVIDSIVVHHAGDFLVGITGRGAGMQVRQWLEKFIIMEDVKIVDRTGDGFLFAQMNSPSADEHSFDADQRSCFHSPYFGGKAIFYYWDEAIEPPPVVDQLVEKKVSREAFELYCIEHGIIQSEPEVLLECNPLELNLWDQVSFTKGCYIGQEVVARLDTYKKVQRTLCRIHVEPEFSDATKHRLFSQQKEVGILLNNGVLTGNGDHRIALAVIRKEYALLGARYLVDNSKTSITIGRIFDHNGKINGNNHNNC